MADFVPGFNLTELLKLQLKCPVCSITMKPPIFQCSSGHPICEQCWKKEEKCLSCDETYKKELKPDMYLGYKLYYYPREYLNISWSDYNDFKQFAHIVKGDGEPYRYGDRRLFPLNGVLVTEAELKTAKLAFKPMRNLHLEMYTAFVLYPCENEGCAEKIALAGKQVHDTECAHRIVGCPVKDCVWKGSIQLVSKHVLDSSEHAAIKIELGSPFEFSFKIPHSSTEGTEKTDKTTQNLVLHYGTLETALVLSIAFPVLSELPILLSLAHLCAEPAAPNMICKVRFRSSNSDGDTLMYSFVAQDSIGKKWISIPPFSFLGENGYLSIDNKGQKVKVEVIVKYKKEEVQASSDEKPSVLASVD